MAWTAPATATVGQVLTAAFWNAQVRDNFKEAAPSKVTTKGDIVVASGANTIDRVAAFDGNNLLKHERGGLEADISAVVAGDAVVGTGTGTIGLLGPVTAQLASANTDTKPRAIAPTTLRTIIDAHTRSLPAYPATGDRDNKIPKFDGDNLGWEIDGGGAELPAYPAAGSRNNKIPKFDGDALGWELDAAEGGVLPEFPSAGDRDNKVAKFNNNDLEWQLDLIPPYPSSGSRDNKVPRFNGDNLAWETVNDGARGPTGPRGPRGYTGGQGGRGPTGPQGPQGDTGPQGGQGPAGDRGPRGWTGAKGDRGDKGDTGDRGPAGSTGPRGATGSRGPRGWNGSDGSTGPAGATGARGPTGPRGPKGDKGDAGSTVLYNGPSSTARTVSVTATGAGSYKVLLIVVKRRGSSGDEYFTFGFHRPTGGTQKYRFADADVSFSRSGNSITVSGGFSNMTVYSVIGVN